MSLHTTAEYLAAQKRLKELEETRRTLHNPAIEDEYHRILYDIREYEKAGQERGDGLIVFLSPRESLMLSYFCGQREAELRAQLAIDNMPIELKERLQEELQAMLTLQLKLSQLSITF